MSALIENHWICQDCHSKVIRWRGGWKHARGWHSKGQSCGLPPNAVHIMCASDLTSYDRRQIRRLFEAQR